MKSTDSTLILPRDTYISKDGRKMLDGFVLRFNLSEEDFILFREKVMPLLPNCDLADGLLGMITYGIHRALEEIEGVPFVLDMDRKKNKS